MISTLCAGEGDSLTTPSSKPCFAFKTARSTFTARKRAASASARKQSPKKAASRWPSAVDPNTKVQKRSPSSSIRTCSAQGADEFSRSAAPQLSTTLSTKIWRISVSATDFVTPLNASVSTTQSASSVASTASACPQPSTERCRPTPAKTKDEEAAPFGSHATPGGTAKLLGR